MAKSSLFIQMLRLLRDRPGLTVPQLSKILGRSERTICRWLSEVDGTLQMHVRCREGGYYLTGTRSARQVELTPHELLALRLSLKSSPFRDGSPVGDSAESAWRKIRDAVPWQDVDAAEELALSHSMQITAPLGDISPGVVEAIEHAVDNHLRLHLVYRSQKSARVKEYLVDPYAVAFRRHAWYMVGFSEEHQKPVQFKLVRVIGARETGETFTPPEDFHVEEFFGSSWEGWVGEGLVTVRVRFSPRVADVIAEVKRHPSQVTYPQDDGSVIFEATVAGIDEIAIWIMGYGKEAEVLEPESLRLLIIDNARGMLANYEH